MQATETDFLSAIEPSLQPLNLRDWEKLENILKGFCYRPAKAIEAEFEGDLEDLTRRKMSAGTGTAERRAAEDAIMARREKFDRDYRIVMQSCTSTAQSCQLGTMLGEGMLNSVAGVSRMLWMMARRSLPNETVESIQEKVSGLANDLFARMIGITNRVHADGTLADQGANENPPVAEPAAA
jgi:hypothetical protein